MKIDSPREEKMMNPPEPGAKAGGAMAGAERKKGRARKRRWVPYAGVLAVVGLLVAGFWPKPVPVETARVTRGTIQATVNEEGKTRIAQRYVVSTPISGQLRRIPFKAGAEVKAGETVLAVLDPLAPGTLDARTRALAEARRESARANLERARAAHEFARREFNRVRSLFSDQAVSQQEFEQAQWQETSTAKELAVAESALREAEAELADFAAADAGHPRPPVGIRAPVSGQILRVFEESTRAVAPGTPLLEVGNPADLEVIVEVLSRDGAAIRPGARVELHQWGGAQPLEAVVRLVEPAAFTKISALGVEEQRVNVVADIVTPADQRLGLGDAFRVEARIITQELTNALKVASGALFRKKNGWAAFVVQDGKAQSRDVGVGFISGPESQIASGLAEGDLVILYPGDRIREGQRVELINLNPE